MTPIPKVSAKKYPLRGLGDVVASLAHPIAVIADHLLGTDLQHCPTCKKQRDQLNRLTLN